MVNAILVVLLVIGLWKWWHYRCFCIGLMYFAKIDHNWVIDDLEMKKIVEYSMRRGLDDLFKH